MIEYNLAKQLKDAGFPQHNLGEVYHPDGCTNEACHPTLSELIEACGKDFGVLGRNNSDRKIGNTDPSHYWCADFLMKFTDNFTGSTPEEAVAKLWLELHK